MKILRHLRCFCSYQKELERKEKQNEIDSSYSFVFLLANNHKFSLSWNWLSCLLYIGPLSYMNSVEEDT